MRTFKVLLSAFLAFVFCLSAFTFVFPKVEAYGETFFIDVGHGGDDPGAVGPGGREEADDVLRLSLRVGEILAPYTTYRFSRTGEVTLSLSDRSSMANAGGHDYLISIHRNSFSNTSAKGLEVWWSEWTASNDTNTCIKFAQNVYDGVMEQVPVFTQRGLKSGVKLHMTTYPKMPSCLIETGFISNTEDNQIFDDYFEQIAFGIAKGMLAMIGIVPDGSKVETWVEKAAFDTMVYRDRNPDLAGLTDEELKEHWLETGIDEGRGSSPVLDLGFYLANNDDLKAAYGNDYRKAYEHFIEYGYKEKRKSSALFDGKYYTEHYPEAEEKYGDDYMRHYVEHGILAGHRASLTFDPDYYWHIKPEVWEAWPAHYELCAKHYAGYGVREGVEAYDNKLPVISDATITNITSAGYTVTCTVTDNWGIEFVSFPTWTLLNDQDDLAADFFNTQRGTADGDTYTFYVKASDHNNELGAYVTHIYAQDKGGNLVSLPLDAIEVKDVSLEQITLVPSSKYSLDGALLFNVTTGTTVNQLLSQFDNTGLKVVDASGNATNGNSVIGTGAKVSLYNGAELIDSITVIILGDVDGNANIDATDYIRVKSVFLGGFAMNNIEKAAADVDGNGVIDATDYIRIKSQFLG